ncbi:MAG: LON peptidase substrate-binding domain-containing protein [Gemmataceae bacterium]
MSNDPTLEMFDGKARIFPLPNLVLFPSIVQGLHLFEPRYRVLAADSLDDNSLFAMAVFQPGWEGEYEGSPALEPIACLGEIMTHEKLPDGRYQLRLRGVTRIRLTREITDGTPYRVFQSEVAEEIKPTDLHVLSARRKDLSRAVLARFEPDSLTHRQLVDLFSSEATLGQVCDVISYSLPLPTELKYQLLAELRVTERVEILINALGQVRKNRKFPPEFSMN